MIGIHPVHRRLVELQLIGRAPRCIRSVDGGRADGSGLDVMTLLASEGFTANEALAVLEKTKTAVLNNLKVEAIND